MFPRALLLLALVVFQVGLCHAQEAELPELHMLKQYAGVWDAQIEVWPTGPDGPSITFQGVETVRRYGDHWIASDFDSELQGQTMRVHAIVGYDLEKKKLVGTVIDHGPYAASMVGEFDPSTNTVHWKTAAKTADGKPMTQKTQVTQPTPNERTLVLLTHDPKTDRSTKTMQIRYVKRKE